MIKLKYYMNEIEMEQYLIENGYDIFDEEECIDSTLVIENALLLGYNSKLDDNNEFLKFEIK